MFFSWAPGSRSIVEMEIALDVFGTTCLYIIFNLLFSNKLTTAGYGYRAIRLYGMATCQVCLKVYILEEGFAKHMRKVHPNIDHMHRILKEMLR